MIDTATDVLAAGWREKPPARELPRVEASVDLVVEVAADGFCGAVVGVASGLVELEDRQRRRRLFPLGAGFLVDGDDVVLVRPHVGGGPTAGRADGVGLVRRSPTHAPASRGQAASSSKGGTTPSSSRRCGATTCAPREWSSSICRGSTCSRPRWTTSRRPRSGGTACWSTTSCAARRSPASRTRSRGAARRARAHRRPPVGSTCGSASRRARSASRGGRTSRAASIQGGRVPRARVARPRPGGHRASLAADPGRGDDAIATSSPRCSAASRSSSTS